jgi:hypothetical protein
MWWHTVTHGGEVKVKLANGVGIQYLSHYLGTQIVSSEHGVSSITTITNADATPRLPAVDWTDAPADLNELVRFAERRNLVSARVPTHFKCSLLSWNLRERDHWRGPDVDGRIILRWIFRKWEGVVRTWRSWLRIGTGGGHLWVRCWIFGFQKCGEFLD